MYMTAGHTEATLHVTGLCPECAAITSMTRLPARYYRFTFYLTLYCAFDNSTMNCLDELVSISQMSKDYSMYGFAETNRASRQHGVVSRPMHHCNAWSRGCGRSRLSPSQAVGRQKSTGKGSSGGLQVPSVRMGQEYLGGLS